ncbi:MAG: hypothetical protein WDZ42_01090 [Candidatus Saccharimonadales bacterium]
MSKELITHVPGYERSEDADLNDQNIRKAGRGVVNVTESLSDEAKARIMARSQEGGERMQAAAEATQSAKSTEIIRDQPESDELITAEDVPK